MISANLKILVKVYFALRKLGCTLNVPESANTQVKEVCVTFSVTSILLRDQWPELQPRKTRHRIAVGHFSCDEAKKRLEYSIHVEAVSMNGDI